MPVGKEIGGKLTQQSFTDFAHLRCFVARKMSFTTTDEAFRWFCEQGYETAHLAALERYPNRGRCHQFNIGGSTNGGFPKMDGLMVNLIKMHNSAIPYFRKPPYL